ncbi:MAG: hypothetical protein PHU25_17180 [Deltaproteobacteria bacterium]|nr:hypothetical protein [Deltaproteobacteria bacterium]
MMRIVVTFAALATLSCSEPRPSPPASVDATAKGATEGDSIQLLTTRTTSLAGFIVQR